MSQNHSAEGADRNNSTTGQPKKVAAQIKKPTTVDDKERVEAYLSKMCNRGK